MLLTPVINCARSLSIGLNNLIRWLPIIWFDADYDWEYIATVLEYKLRRHALLELERGSHAGSGRHGKQMLVCANLVRRLLADEYVETARKRYGDTAHALKVANQQGHNDQHYLGLLLGKHFTSWWI